VQRQNASQHPAQHESPGESDVPYIRSRKHAAIAAALAHAGHPDGPAPTRHPPLGPAQARSHAARVKARAEPTTRTRPTTLSSPKFTQPLLDTPQTITVIKKELIQQQAATTLSEALRNSPGITMLLGENGNTQTGDAVVMRGFDTSQSIFVDNIRDIGAISRDMFNIEQVEVVKGPSGADNGRGASSATSTWSARRRSRATRSAAR
jgi:catecholate siderophore receptor